MSKSMQLKAIIKKKALMHHVPAQAVLQNYMLERLLERVSISKYKDMFVLKGGLLIASIVGVDSRTTMDMDATILNYQLSEEKIKSMFNDICKIFIEDEVSFKLQLVFPIRSADEYGGYRISILSTYETIHTPLKVDITTGDELTPNAISYRLHSNFTNKTIKIQAYNVETILAEKIETILSRGVLNTRPRDFYDVYTLVKTQGAKIKKKLLKTAIIATMKKRNSLSSLENKRNILQIILSDETMRKRWEIYCKENYYAKDIRFDEVINTLIDIET